MKKSLILLLALICVGVGLHAQHYSHTFTFNLNDFEVVKDNSDSVKIISLKSPAVYPDADQPALPRIGRNLAFVGDSVANFTFEITKHVIDTCVDLCNSSKVLSTDLMGTEIFDENNGYYSITYPNSNCILANQYEVGGVNIACFSVTPFVFDAEHRVLYFVDSIMVDIEYGECNSFSNIRMNSHLREMLSDIVDNPEVFDYMPMVLYNPYLDDYIDYIIITNADLKNSFKPLAEWKRKKGVPTKILTVEEIDSAYTGATQQIRIKTCIKDYFENHNTQFVLLGGDVNIIPTYMCYIDDGRNNKDYIPADIYYSCLGDFDWDTNKNGFAGDVEDDKFDYVPVVYLTRTPVRTNADAVAFVSRTIDYERSPIFNREILQSGSELYELGLDYCKGETFADMFFDNVINGKLFIGTTKFFDTFTYSGVQFSKSSFMAELEKGYQFCQVYSHGESDMFAFKNHNGKFIPFCNVESASSLNNMGHTMVTTMACHTNSFDKEESNYGSTPCLSEAFIRNPNSGVIGYLGSSRYGWFYPNYTLELSPRYEIEFYYRLLNIDVLPTRKHLGALVNFTKCSFLGLLTKNKDNGLADENGWKYYRWLHYSVNPLGDPEMPLYSVYPREFINSSVSYLENGRICVNTGVSDARVCVSGKNTDYYQIGWGPEVYFDLDYDDYDVWITSQNYIPKYYTAVRDNHGVGPENKILLITPNPASSYITVRYQTVVVDATCELMLMNVDGIYGKRYELTGSHGEKTIDISALPKGIYIAAMLVYGDLVTYSDRVIIQ